MDFSLEAVTNFLAESAANVTLLVSDVVPDNVQNHIDLTKEAYHSTLTAIRLWGLVFLPAFNFCVWLCMTVVDIVLPILPPIWEFFKTMSKQLWGLFMTHAWPVVYRKLIRVKEKLLEADPTTIIFTVLSLALLMILVRTARAFVNAGYISRGRMYVQVKTAAGKKIMQKALNGLSASTFHAILIVHAIVTVLYMPGIANALTHSSIYWWICVFYPSYAALSSIHKYKMGDTSQKSYERLNKWLVYWSVAIALAIVLQLPFVLMVVGNVEIIYMLRCHFVFWLWFPYTNGASFMFDLLVPFINTFIRTLPGPGVVGPTEKGLIENMINGLVPPKVKWMVDWGLQVGPILLVSLVFFLTPGVLTAYGAIFVGQVYPCYMSLTTLIRNTTQPAVTAKAPFKSGMPIDRKLSSTPSTPTNNKSMTPGNDVHVHQTHMPRGHKNDNLIPEYRHDVHWLTYWAAFAPMRVGIHVLAWYLDGLPLWHHAELALIIWLMTSGADTVVNELDLLIFRQDWRLRNSGVEEATETPVTASLRKRDARHKEASETTSATTTPLRSNRTIDPINNTISEANIFKGVPRQRINRQTSESKRRTCNVEDETRVDAHSVPIMVELPDVTGAFRRLYALGTSSFTKTLNLELNDDVINIFAAGAILILTFAALCSLHSSYKVRRMEVNKLQLVEKLRSHLESMYANREDQRKLLTSVKKVKRLATEHSDSVVMMKIFIKEDVHELSLKILHDNMDVPEVAAEMMDLLSIILEPTAREAPSYPEVGDLTISIALRHSNETVLIKCLRLLATLCMSTSSHQELINNDNFFEVVNCGFESTSESMQIEACRVVQRCAARCTVNTQKNLLKHGYHVRLLLTLRNAKNSSTADVALGALANVAHKNDQNDLLIEVGAIEIIHNTIADSFEDAGVVMRGIGALLNLAVFGNDVKANRKALTEAQTSQLATVVMKKFKSDYMIQQRAMALRDVLKRSIFG
eukprot:CFRG0951T1